MKFIICSDIHGDFEGAEYAVSLLEKERADRLIILGDILYHGPRNNLPPSYNPKAVTELLNKHRDRIIAVRGNCDTEVDAMVLKFPVTSQFATVFADGKTLVLTHGHKVDLDNPPPLCDGDFLLCGHTHVPAKIKFGNNNTYLNPGSVSLPKNNFPRSCMIFENGNFKIVDLSGNEISL